MSEETLTPLQQMILEAAKAGMAGTMRRHDSRHTPLADDAGHEIPQSEVFEQERRESAAQPERTVEERRSYAP